MWLGFMIKINSLLDGLGQQGGKNISTIKISEHTKVL